MEKQEYIIEHYFKRRAMPETEYQFMFVIKANDWDDCLRQNTNISAFLDRKFLKIESKKPKLITEKNRVQYEETIALFNKSFNIISVNMEEWKVALFEEKPHFLWSDWERQFETTHEKITVKMKVRTLFIKVFKKQPIQDEFDFVFQFVKGTD